MRFIELTYMDDTKVWVNMKQVVAYESIYDSITGKFLHTKVYTNVTQFNIKETARKISAEYNHSY